MLFPLSECTDRFPSSECVFYLTNHRWLRWREVWNYYMDSKLRGIFPWSNFTGLENRPASEWDEKYLGSDAVVEELPW